jgi:hypothetical protein
VQTLSENLALEQGCQIFLGRKYQNEEKYTKCPQNILNDPKIYQMTQKYTKLPQNIPISHNIYQHFPLPNPPKFTQIWIFGLKIFHLEILLWRERKKSRYVPAEM